MTNLLTALVVFGSAGAIGAAAGGALPALFGTAASLPALIAGALVAVMLLTLWLQHHRRQSIRRAVWVLLLVPALAAGLLPNAARAEVQQVRIVQQFGLTYLPLIVMRHGKLVEKQAARSGANGLTVEWTRLGGGAAVNDALLTGSVDFASAGLGPLLILWDRTRASLGVKALGALDASAVALTTNNPSVQSLRDLGPNDRIALPAVKVSHQAILLQMAAEQLFGAGQHQRFDTLTVTMAHPDAMTALVSRRTEITGHFGNAPFIQQELMTPGIRRILGSEQILGGPGTVTSLFGTGKFRDANPKAYRAVLEALREAHALIASDRREAARIYLEEEKPKLTLEQVVALLDDPTAHYALQPINTEKFAEFMHRTGLLRSKPASWQEYYFPEIHGEAGS